MHIDPCTRKHSPSNTVSSSLCLHFYVDRIKFSDKVHVSLYFSLSFVSLPSLTIMLVSVSARTMGMFWYLKCVCVCVRVQSQEEW